jgi:hypothetical protein
LRDLAAPVQTVVYTRNAGTLQLTRNGQPLADGIQTLTFSYFLCDGTAAALGTQAQRNLIARVRIVITARGAVAGDTQSRTLRSDVRLRNLPCNGGL